MEYAIKIAISLITVVIFFAFYFRNFLFRHVIIQRSQPFFLGVLSSTAAVVIQQLLPRTDSNVIIAFVHASLVEESIRFVIIWMLIRQSTENFTVYQGIFDSILLGLGFAFAENLHYSVNYDGFVILLRCVSSVPVHVFASGIMGYFMAYRHFCHESRKWYRRFNWFGIRRWWLLFTALFIPWLYHGFFDLMLFKSGGWHYTMPLFLMGGFMYLEYLITLSRHAPGKVVLELLGLDIDEMRIIQRQVGYDLWLDGVQSEKDHALFQNKWSPLRTIAGISLSALAGVMYYLIQNHPGYFRESFGSHTQVLMALLVLMPLSTGAILLLADKINYNFFQEYMLRIPGGAFVTMENEGNKYDGLVLDILPRGIFLPGFTEVPAGEKMIVTFHHAGREVWMFGETRWVNEAKVPVGTLFKFLKPHTGYTWFRVYYYYDKLRLRLGYNLRKIREQFRGES